MPSLPADYEALEAETAAASYLRGLAIASGALECVLHLYLCSLEQASDPTMLTDTHAHGCLYPPHAGQHRRLGQNSPFFLLGLV